MSHYPHLQSAHTGGVLDDIWGGVKDIFSSIPGSEWVDGAISAGAGWLKDVAQDDVGRLVLVGITNAMLFPAVAGIAIPSASGMQTIGPQVASVVWAVPNLAAGDGFVESYAAEVTWRFQYLATIFSGGLLSEPAKNFLEGTRKALKIPKIQTVTEQVWRSYGSAAPTPKPGELAPPIQSTLDASKIHNDSLKASLKKMGADPVTLAKQLGIREDAAAAAINGLMGRNIWGLNSDFTDEGKLIPKAEVSTRADSVSKKTRELFSQAARPYGGKPFLAFVSNTNVSPRGPVGQALLLALLTAPAWASVLLPHLVKRLR